MSRIEGQAASQLGEVARAGHQPQERVEQNRAAEERVAEAEVVEVSGDDVRSASEALKQVVEVASGRNLEFQIHDGTEDLVVQITDRASSEVIRQIPGEEVLRLREHLDQLVGIMIDREA